MTTTHRWVAGAVTAALLLVAGSWFLLISPQRAQAAQLRADAVAQQSTNDTIRLRTEQLRAQFASLPQRRAELAEIQQQLPSSPELPTLLRQLSTVADDAGVSVDSVSPGQPQPLTSAAAGSAAGSAAASAAGSAAGSSAAGTADVRAIATTMVVKGGYAELTLFLQKLQGSMRRAYLVENLSLSPGEAATGADRTSEVPLTMTLTGKVFVLAPPAGTTGSAGTPGSSATPGTAGSAGTAVVPSTTTTAN
jgi:type IV pilus assembly protein PilO